MLHPSQTNKMNAPWNAGYDQIFLFDNYKWRRKD